MADAVVVAAARTPIGRAHKGRLAQVRSDDLAVVAARAALAQAPDLPGLDDLYLGASQHTGEQAQNLARRVAVLLGMDDLPGATVNRGCASSIQTTRMAFHAIRAGEGRAFLSVGVESVSRYRAATPDTDHPAFAEAGHRTRARATGTLEDWSDPRVSGELPDYYIPMGQTAENVATLRGISREAQDELAYLSQQRYAKALADGFFARQITPVELPGGSVVDEDESPRPGTTIEKLAELPPVFRPNGTVTAGNSCPLNDGAAAVLVVEQSLSRTVDGHKARIVSTGVSALSPEVMGLGPVEASRSALWRADMTIDDIDLVEMNEAFAAQLLPSCRDLQIDLDRLNVNGGAIAMGHPFGMTGARLIGSAVQAMGERDLETALVTLCVGMGQGMAIVLERV